LDPGDYESFVHKYSPAASLSNADVALGNDLRAIALLDLGVTEAWSLGLAEKPFSKAVRPSTCTSRWSRRPSVFGAGHRSERAVQVAAAVTRTRSTTANASAASGDACKTSRVPTAAPMSIASTASIRVNADRDHPVARTSAASPVSVIVSTVVVRTIDGSSGTGMALARMLGDLPDK
jgi:hypothetical protein